MLLTERMPSLYVGHGAPTVAIDPDFGQYKMDLRKYGKKFPNPTSVVVVSAHWQDYLPIQITGSTKPGIIYDYYGFPDEMYQLKYDFKGDPELANMISQILSTHRIDSVINRDKGIDHGAWIPLREIYPESQIPIIQMSIPVPRTQEYLYKIGQILAPLRGDGVMFIGSGNIVHNLSHIMGKISSFGNTGANQSVESWSFESDIWVKEQLDDLKIDNLLKSRELMPNFSYAVPTTEHFDPLYFILGTLQNNESINHFHESFQYGSISMRSFHTEY
ncbi:MAG: hypothetical protein HeimC2_39960 [Candidatus Heimdallarchaeota archaeon LC_2]|nr:MAG: hypothetical protein HeimC2_39960 [Candidatus Heimdallarchaeota archaeon LC_2]